MSNNEKEYYYAGGKKIKLNKIPDSFAVKHKDITTSRTMATKMAAKNDFADAEERKELPKQRMVIVTLPPTRRLADVQASLDDLEADNDVEFVTPVYREANSGLRLVATDEITVRFKSDASQQDIDKFNEENGVEVIEQNRFMPNQYLFRVKNSKDTIATANKFQESDLTEFAEPNFIAEAQKAFPITDEFFNEQWYLHNTGQNSGLMEEDVRAVEAWDITEGSEEITIAIIDDGVDIDHPDLSPNIWQNPDSGQPDVHGWNFFDDNDNPRPQKFTPPYHLLEGNDSHGTPCAGVAAAAGYNAIGVAGIAPKCKILPVKIFLADDLVAFNVLADAIRYAGQKADVLSNSWSTSSSSNVEQAIKEVVRLGRGGKGAPVFVATGNGYRDTIGFPARVPEAIAVGASTNQGRRSSYSNYGSGIDFVAPSNGGTKGIFTTDVSLRERGFNVGDINSGDAEGLYTNSFGGTSSATPLAAGIAALILSLNPGLRWDQVRKYMRENADKIDEANGSYSEGYSLEYGYGRVNAFKALKAIRDDIEQIPPHVIVKQAHPEIPIPDHDLEGIVSFIDINEEGTIDLIEEVSVNILHTYRGDLLVSLVGPDNTEISLHQGLGGGADNLIETYTTGNVPALQNLSAKSVRGRWMLKVVDSWADDEGILNSWGLRIRLQGGIVRGSASPGTHIPDKDPLGIENTIDLVADGQIKDIKVSVDISHTYTSDLTVRLISPSDTEVLLHNKAGGGNDNIQTEYDSTSHPQLAGLIGENISGAWKLAVADHIGLDTGKLNHWEIEVRL